MNAPHRHSLPLIELDLLKTLVAIAETGNFSAAAEAVLRTPSAISMQVKRMEELLGRPLFVRDSRSVSLTPDGEAMLVHARRVLALNREIVARFVTPDVTGTVRLGAPDDAAERLLPEMLKRFSQSHPCVTVDVLVANSNVLIDHVRHGRLDMAIITCHAGFDDEDAEILLRERLAWVGLKGGIAHEKRPLPISVWEEGCVWRRAGTDRLSEVGIDYRVAFQSSNISGQKAAILADLAIAPIPESALDDRFVRLDGSHGPLPDLPEYSMGLVTARNLTGPAQAAADHLRASFAQA